MDQEFANQQKAVVDYFSKWMSENPNRSICLGTIESLDHIMQKLTLSSTTEFLRIILPSLTSSLINAYPSLMSVKSACTIYQRVVSRGDFDSSGNDWSLHVRKNSAAIAASALDSPNIIHRGVNSFVSDGQVILVHGYSRIVSSSLINAAVLNHKRFSVIITESRPDCEGYRVAAQLKQFNIPVTIMVDAMAAHVMDHVDLVLVGAEAVVENGGIINKIGTYQIAIVAKALSKPVYVIAESFKFQRLFLFHQQDISDNNISPLEQQNNMLSHQQQQQQQHQLIVPAKDSAAVHQNEYLQHKWDYTPPDYITLLFTDLGILSPPAVSDELIKLHY